MRYHRSRRSGARLDLLLLLLLLQAVWPASASISHVHRSHGLRGTTAISAGIFGVVETFHPARLGGEFGERVIVDGDAVDGQSFDEFEAARQLADDDRVA